MHEFDTAEKNLLDEKSQNSNRSTGPTSPEGKARSSLNHLTHGCRSQRTVLPFENPEEWDFTLQSWMKAYRALDPSCTRQETTAYNPQAHTPFDRRCPPEEENSHDGQDPTAATLVFETARAQWIFQRNQQRLDETESGLPPDAIEWTEDHIKRYNNFLRYKTTAERSFYRAFNNLEAYCKRQADEAAAAERARAQMAKIQIQWLKKQAEAAAENLRRPQLVDVTANSRGECVTTFTPTNEALITAASKADKPPQFVTRFVLFTAGVPPAYDWLNPNHIQVDEPVIGVQQFTWSGWLQQIEAEKLAATGHLEPYATGLLANV